MERRMHVKSMEPHWCTITNGVSQGSVLTRVMFVMYIIGINNNINLLAYGAKLFRNIKDC